jgi:UDP-N-acetylmuramate: L-alanyl-gamma-D-glutamyl-meso-diaminopimelate ligase
MRVHLIAIGGSAMHNLALSLHQKGYKVTGSDDEIREPSLSRLKAAGLLPPAIGWFPEKITPDIDAIILGMHARADNPELLKAQELGLTIYSYPEYIYQQTKNKTRIVVGGSHGKTTITAMILHALTYHKIPCDYLVGAQLKGFDTMVKLSNDSQVAVIEGDEYLASPIDRRPKFHLYHPNIAIISGIAWDHINVFPTFENYIEQFKIFTDLIEENGTLIYSANDEELIKLAPQFKNHFIKIPYHIPVHQINNGVTSVFDSEGNSYPLQIFGDHNLQNLMAAYYACKQVGLSEKQFYTAIQSFTGAARRLELVARTPNAVCFKDFAHAPSKLKATLAAVKKQFANYRIIATVELHTFSSLNEDFLIQYRGTAQDADYLLVYFNPKVIEHKKLKPISPQFVKACFNSDRVQVVTDTNLWLNTLTEKWTNIQGNKVLLLMTSGNFDGVNLDELGKSLLEK